MSGGAVWLRRSSGRFAFPAFLAVVLVVAFSRDSWWWEWDWALSWVSGSTIVLAPLLAGVAAYDMAIRVTPTMREVAAGSRRGWAMFPHVVLGSWLYAVGSWVIGVIAVGVAAAWHGAEGPFDPTILLHVPVVLLAAASIGGLVGAVIQNVASAPVAVALVYGLPIVGLSAGWTDVLSAGGATGPIAGMERNPAVLYPALLTALAVAVVCAAAAAVRLTPSRVVPVATGAVAAVVCLGSAWVLASAQPMLNGYRPSATPLACVGSQPEVCGPAGAGRLLKLAQPDLAEAAAILRPSGFSFPEEYILVGPMLESHIQSGRGLLETGVESIDDEHIDRRDVLVSLATPTVCRAFFDDVPPVELLDAQARLAEWFGMRLDGTNPRDLDETALETFAALEECDATAVPEWPPVEEEPPWEP